MSVELHDPNQIAAQITTTVPDMVSLPEKINIASGTWYAVIDLASVSSFLLYLEGGSEGVSP